MTFQWVAFVVCALISIAGALGMATTMSMFRSGIFLMASFIGVAGLFVLLQADLLALLQVMMYVGGMLVMILYMVLFSGDPGGAMMADMEMNPVERFFSLGIKPSEHEGDMDMDMSMTTPIKQPAAWMGMLSAMGLTILLLWKPAFPVRDQRPDLDSPRQVGNLLMGKYMLGFEGAGLLILTGIFGAVYAARPTSHPDDPSREAYVAVDEPPPEITS
ncbi:MAG: NADH-quinone oxidoreductase subunit J [Vulcanimicrobiota bacterium]